MKKMKKGEENTIVLMFSYKIKLFMIIVLCLVTFLILWCKKSGSDSIDVYCCLLFFCFIAYLYFVVKRITIFKDRDYFEYRNIFFYTRKIYYKEIRSIQAIMEGLHITMNDGSVIKIFDIYWLGYGTLAYYCKKNGVKEIPRRYFNKIRRD